jgi:hypothetical protein
MSRPGVAGASWITWSSAATIAKQLRGTTPHGPAAAVASDLDRLTRWVRSQAKPGRLAGGQKRRTATDQLAVGLPALAEVLRAGVVAAASRGDLFRTKPELELQPRKMVYHAVAKWGVAAPTDSLIMKLGVTLAAAGHRHITGPQPKISNHSPRLARLAFPSATTTGSSPQEPEFRNGRCITGSSRPDEHRSPRR